MPARLLIFLLAGLLALVPAACGGGDDDSAQDVNTLLEQTFSGDKQVDSGKLALTLTVDAKGSDQVQGPVTLELGGPFQKPSPDELPKFDLDATLTGAGLTYEFGATSTGDKGFVLFQNEDYVLSQKLFDQFKSGFADAQKENAQGQNGQPVDLATLGIDPRNWLTNARTAGSAKVGDEDTIKITGGVDVPKLVDDLSKAGARAREMDADKSAAPADLSDAQKRRIDEAIQGMRVELYTGSDDKTLRRIVLDADVKAPAGTKEFDTAKLKLDYAITELNEDQTIEAPSDPRPFEELAGQMQGRGLLGDLGSDKSGAGSSGSSRRDLERYTRCVKQADSDEAAVQKCSDML